MAEQVNQHEITFATADRGGDYLPKLNALVAKDDELSLQHNALVEEVAASNATYEEIQEFQAQLTEELTTIRNETTAISTAGLNWQARISDTSVATGERLLLETPNMQVLLDTFKANLEKGHWFSLKNTSGQVVYVVGIAGITVAGKTSAINEGDRLVINPGSTRSFVATSLTNVEVR